MTCETLIDQNLEDTLADLRSILCGKRTDAEESGITSLCDYGLAFDYVAPGTFADQKEGYFRYHLSWGGPSDEFRFFVNPDLSCHTIEYWFMNWFDGACRRLEGDSEQLLAEIWYWLQHTGSAKAALDDAGGP